MSVSPDGALEVKQVYAAVDCGDVVNTDTATAQVEGGIIFGLSAALLGAITIANGTVVESNFHDYKTITLVDAPPIQVDFIISGAHPGGLGEPARAADRSGGGQRDLRGDRDSRARAADQEQQSGCAILAMHESR